MITLVAFEVQSESKRNSDKIFCAETLSSQKQKHQSLQLIACYSSGNSFWNCQLGSKQLLTDFQTILLPTWDTCFQVLAQNSKNCIKQKSILSQNLKSSQLRILLSYCHFQLSRQRKQHSAVSEPLLIFNIKERPQRPVIVKTFDHSDEETILTILQF